MPLGDVDRVGHGDAVEFHPGMCEWPCAEAGSRTYADHRTRTAPRQDEPDQLRSSDARRAPQMNPSGDAVDGPPDPVRVTRDPGERKAPQVGHHGQCASRREAVGEVQDGQRRESDSRNEDLAGAEAPIGSVDVGTGDHEAHRTARPLMSRRPQQSGGVGLS